MAVLLSLLAGAGAQFFDGNGVPLAGGKLYTYAAGTTTPQTVYTTSAGNVAHTNPIILDSAGRIPSGGEVWITEGLNYKFTLKTSVDVEQWTADNINNNGVSQLRSDLANRASSAVGGGMIGFDQTVPYALNTVAGALRGEINIAVYPYMGVDDGTTVNDTAFALAYTNLPNGGTIYCPRITNGIYKITTTLAYADTNAHPRPIRLRGDGKKQTCIAYYGASSNGAIRVSADAAYSGGVYSCQNAGTFMLEDMAVYSSKGPCITLYSCNKWQLRNVLVMSNDTSSYYGNIIGSFEGSLWNTTDLSNDTIPYGWGALLGLPGGNSYDSGQSNTGPSIGWYITDGTYNDGTHGSAPLITREIHFYDFRTDGYYNTSYSVAIKKTSATATETISGIFFHGGKHSNPPDTAGGHTTDPAIYIDGAINVHLIGSIYEPSNPAGVTKPVIVLDNQLGDTELHIQGCWNQTSGYIDLGVNGGSTGAYTISLIAIDAQAYNTRLNYAASAYKTIDLRQFQFGQQPTSLSGVGGTIPHFHLDGWVKDPNTGTVTALQYEYNESTTTNNVAQTVRNYGAAGSILKWSQSLGTPAAPSDSATNNVIAGIGGYYRKSGVETFSGQMQAAVIDATNKVLEWQYLDYNGTVYAGQSPYGLRFVARAAAAVPNHTLFEDSADGILKYRDGAGVLHSLW